MQRFFVFFNGYGASVVRYLVTPPDVEPPIEGSPGALAGLWDLAILEIDYPVVPTGDLPFSWTICYHTDIAPDTVGWLSEDGVDEILSRIEALPSRSRDRIPS